MPGKTWRATKTWLITLTSQMRCHSSFGASGPPPIAIPALEQKMSIRPCVASTCSINFFTSDSRDTSHWTAVPRISRAVAEAPSISRSATTTASAPAPAKPLARARPMPLAPPVTTITLPAASTGDHYRRGKNWRAKYFLWKTPAPAFGDVR